MTEIKMGAMIGTIIDMITATGFKTMITDNNQDNPTMKTIVGYHLRHLLLETIIAIKDRLAK